jgi:hypothetical protein
MAVVLAGNKADLTSTGRTVTELEGRYNVLFFR